MRTKFNGIQFNKEQAVAMKKVMACNSVLVDRQKLMSGLGQSYGGDRKLYETLGYKKALSYSDFYGIFTRQDIAKKVVTAFPSATWRGESEVYETDEANNTTTFEVAWKKLLEGINVFHYFARVDKLAGIGRYAILYLGFSDGEPDLSKPVEPRKGMKLLYIQPYSENNAIVESFDSDPTSERFGLPETYKIKVGNVVTSSTSPSGTKATTSATDRLVHWTRVLHVADELLENNVFGTPRLECVFNRFQNLGLIAGGSSEMFWRGGFPGMALEQDANTTITDATALNDEVDEYVHNMRRVLRLQGMKANVLSPSIASPKTHFEMLIALIAGATGIPQRILLGSERGELASTQDKENWNDRVSERRTEFAEPSVIKPFINRLIDLKVLPPVSEENGVNIRWPALDALGDKEQAEIADLRSKAIKAYVESDAWRVVGPLQFLMMFMGFTEEEALAMQEEVEGLIEEERNQEAMDVDAEEDEEEEEEE